MAFRYTKDSPDWILAENSKLIYDTGMDASHNYTLLEDGQGILHLINREELYLTHRILASNGILSHPQRIVGQTVANMGYWAGTTPDGSPCVVWVDSTNVLHIMLYKGSEWREEERPYDLAGSSGLNIRDILLSNVVFDVHGEPHFFYMAGYEDGKTFPFAYGLFLDEHHLAQFDDPASVQVGVGDLSKSICFIIGSDNVYHLVGSDEIYGLSAPFSSEYPKFLHSYSRDGGKTWENPSHIIESENEFKYVSVEKLSISEDAKGNLQVVVVYEQWAQPYILVTTLKHDSFEVETTEGFFGDEQTTEALKQLPIDEMSVYYGMEFQTVVADANGKLYFITNGVDAQYWVISQIEGNSWALLDIEKSDEKAGLAAICLRRNGNLALLSKVYAEHLYFAEIPVE